LFSLLIFWRFTTPLATWLTLIAIVFYVVIYTMALKRRTSQNIVWGGIAGCMPVLIGWAAVTNDLSNVAGAFFFVVFFWTPPHFWALAIKVSQVASGVVNRQKIRRENKPTTVAKIVACLREITPVAIGRCAVRFINLSVSLSITMLKAFALPAAKVPPRIVAIDSPTEGMPFWARTRAGKVVTSKSSTTRNFMRSR